MDHQKIFYTNLFVLDDFYKDSTASMKKYISDLWTNRQYEDNGKQSLLIYINKKSLNLLLI